MEEKDDLMKNIMDDNSKNLKKYLLMGGATFVIFVVGIVIAKFAFEGDSKDNTQIILPPDTTSNSKTHKEASDLFNSINVEKNDNIQTTQKEKVSENSLDDSDDFKKPEPLEENEPVKQVKEKVEKIKEEANRNIETIKQNIEKKADDVKKIAQENIKNVKVVVTDKTKNIEKKQNVVNVVRNYYIQVAAITRGEPSKKFLGLIKQNGFEYTIKEVEINGRKIKRVLVGPFTAEEAKNSLPKVKEKITTSAFIKKLR